jgi:hypothetical protein
MRSGTVMVGIWRKLKYLFCFPSMICRGSLYKKRKASPLCQVRGALRHISRAIRDLDGCVQYQVPKDAGSGTPTPKHEPYRYKPFAAIRGRASRSRPPQRKTRLRALCPKLHNVHRTQTRLWRSLCIEQRRCLHRAFGALVSPEGQIAPPFLASR